MARPGRNWSPEDDALIRATAEAGETARAAAQALGVTRNTVIGRAHRIDVRFDPTLDNVAKVVASGIHRHWAGQRLAKPAGGQR